MIDEKKLIEKIHEYFKAKIDNAPSEHIDLEMLTLNKEICEIVKYQPKVDEWIPCSFDAPDDNQIVVVSTIDGGIHIATFYIAKWKNYCWYLFESGGMFTSPYVTAWMPLPEAYKGEK